VIIVSNRRKPKKPWLSLGEAGTVAVPKNISRAMRQMAKPNRRRTKMLKRRIHVNELILVGKMVPPAEKRK
jgi:hypothetical protein